MIWLATRRDPQVSVQTGWIHSINVGSRRLKCDEWSKNCPERVGAGIRVDQEGNVDNRARMGHDRHAGPYLHNRIGSPPACRWINISQINSDA